jgi:hypothetical protein
MMTVGDEALRSFPSPNNQDRQTCCTPLRRR